MAKGIRQVFSHVIDYSAEITCRDCGVKRAALYFFGVQSNGTGVCVDCMQNHTCGDQCVEIVEQMES